MWDGWMVKFTGDSEQVEAWMKGGERGSEVWWSMTRKSGQQTRITEANNTTLLRIVYSSSLHASGHLYVHGGSYQSLVSIGLDLDMMRDPQRFV
jgi:hypothetical protein